MSKKPYHHGDLRTAMIEQSISFINEHGAGALSLRKVAAACGVSHSAPYSHFANKDVLLAAIESHINDKFIAELEAAVKNDATTVQGLVKLGCAYVLFFLYNPQYYFFIFSRTGNTDGDAPENAPYDFFISYISQVFEEMDYPQEKWMKTATAHWAMMHGLASMAVLDDPDEDGMQVWEDRTREIMSQNYMIFA
ncbi:MAG: TetR/AcrR family transcriptional regulator [Defluviitaleaceae bacterium]|nr:TetR/AcrR family transcriptional regulator [Defluviitaleaceae bacterium]MCL2275936.1 TetR/AcrR family transcriptional regulator [Defluviitaleaceae bacterium]